mmetsp:Transcript_74709/g.142217  ORF Transcript_74709/g.142217 Transcript_74709/m.142217 type:complete len:97 (+) Transcript_74709:70-360(+)
MASSDSAAAAHGLQRSELRGLQTQQKPYAWPPLQASHKWVPLVKNLFGWENRHAVIWHADVNLVCWINGVEEDAIHVIGAFPTNKLYGQAVHVHRI